MCLPVGDTTCPADQKWPKTPSGSTVVSQECEPGKVGSIERTCLGNTWSEILSKCISENLKKVANAANVSIEFQQRWTWKYPFHFMWQWLEDFLNPLLFAPLGLCAGPWGHSGRRSLDLLWFEELLNFRQRDERSRNAGVHQRSKHHGRCISYHQPDRVYSACEMIYDFSIIHFISYILNYISFT